MRVKTGVTRRQHHKKVLARTKGMRMTKNRLYKVAREADVHQGQYEYIGRRIRKRDMRSLWIIRINAGLKQAESTMNYSAFINSLKINHIEINRKMFAELAVSDPQTFKFILAKVEKR